MCKHLLIAVGDTPAGPFVDLSPPITRDWVEGPNALRVGKNYLVYFDAYRDHRYEMLRSRDLKMWEDVSAKLTHPKGMRHGTALAVSGDIVRKLIKSSAAASANTQ